MIARFTLTAVAAMLAVTPVLAQEEVDLPNTITMTSADVGGTAYNQAIAIGKAMQDAYGVSLRVVGSANPQAKLGPVRDGRMPFSMAGSEVFFAFEGLEDYASAEWGPQDLRAVSLVGGDNCLTWMVAGDAGIETMADFEGKRIAWVVGNSALQANMRAMLAFAGLTLDDVTLVEVPSYGAGVDAMIDGQLAGITTVSTGGLVEKAVAGPRGIKYMEYPHDDAEGWERMQAINPYFGKRVATLASGGLDEPLECIGVPYPDLITYSKDAEDPLVYNFTKALDLQVETYSQADPSTAGFAAEKQMLDWMVPYHPAAVRYYDEAGVWNADLQVNNDTLIERAGVLQAAWAEMEGTPGGAEFVDRWLEVRKQALEAAGLPSYAN